MTHLPYTPALLGWATSLLLGSVGLAAAQPAPESSVGRGRVTVTSATHAGEAILAAESADARLEQRTTTTGSGRIVLTAGGDRVEITLGPAELQVVRGGARHRLNARAVDVAEVRAVRELLRVAPAVWALPRLQAAFDTETPVPLTSAAAFVRMLAGDAAGMRRVAASASSAPPAIRAVRQEAAACWSSYQNSMWIFFLDLESCISSNSWNLPVQYACGFTYLVQSELAWFSLIACAGGLPT